MIRLISTPSTSASGNSNATSSTHPPGPQPRSRILRSLDGSAIPESGPPIACVEMRSWLIKRAISVGLSESKTYVLVCEDSIIRLLACANDILNAQKTFKIAIIMNHPEYFLNRNIFLHDFCEVEGKNRRFFPSTSQKSCKNYLSYCAKNLRRLIFDHNECLCLV